MPSGNGGAPELERLPRRRRAETRESGWCSSEGLGESSQPFRPGQLFSERYRIARLLARGGHGLVFVADHLPTETQVALKLVWPHLAASLEEASSLELEARIAARVQSEFIVRVLDAGVDPATFTPFLAMELLEGRSLKRLVRDDGPLGPDDTVRYLSHVAQGLDRAHGYVDKTGRPTPIIHRDLKPENLFLTRREDGTPLVKILDFGVAKLVSGSVTRTTGSISGTPAYMAFEQISGGEIGRATDVWALGLVAFYLLTGRDYWRAASRPGVDMVSLFAEVLHQPIAPPSKRALDLGVAPSWPPGFDGWFLHCVARDPAARFGTAAFAFNELARALGVSVEATPRWVDASSTGIPAGSRIEPARTRKAETARGDGHVQLGARVTGDGATFALFSEHAEAVEVCLFDPEDPARETARLRVDDCRNHVWRVHVPNVGPGQLYGYRVHGHWDPEQGQRFNPHKLLLDPYARRLAGDIVWHEAVLGHRPDDATGKLGRSELDSAPYVPRCVLTASSFAWGDDALPNVPWSDTLIYEAHVRGMSMRHPDIEPGLRGTYLGLVSEPILEHLRDLGVTAVELLPVCHSLTERHLDATGLRNYWGYNPIAFFAPDPRYATPGGDPIDEFKRMVQAFHAADIEVLLDVVYNHTAEGDHLGPTLSFRGIDNACYYRLSRESRGYYQDFTGCGNSLSLLHPRALQLVLDSLRYWAVEMHVDGFRFDLLPALARDGQEFDGFSRFLAAVQQDPALGRLKLIAEPWDLGPNGYQLGAFPPGWSEWNGRYRDNVRRFWRGDRGEARELRDRLAGSLDIFGPSGRDAHASINFVTCHDGFTLEDLVSYEAKQNLPNGHGNGDGMDHNFSANWGEDGPSSAPAVLEARARAKRNFVATLALSRGVPMLLHGDELGRSQRGNNNAYCQDNELTWVNWELDTDGLEFFEFTCEVLRIARDYRVLCERRRSSGRNSEAADASVWLAPDGGVLTDESLSELDTSTFGLLMPSASPTSNASLTVDQPLLLLLNASDQPELFSLPAPVPDGAWHPIVNTAEPGQHAPAREQLAIAPKSLLLLRYQT
jgi:glycogen operon protein